MKIMCDEAMFPFGKNLFNNGIIDLHGSSSSRENKAQVSGALSNFQ